MNSLKQAFAIISFHPPYTFYYEEIYKPAFAESGYNLIRADEKLLPVDFMREVKRGIYYSSLVLCDISIEKRNGSYNANVCYELGYAHAYGKPTILTSRVDSPLPADVQNIITIMYDEKSPLDDHRWMDKLRQDIRNALVGIEETNYSWSSPQDFDEDDQLRAQYQIHNSFGNTDVEKRVGAENIRYSKLRGKKQHKVGDANYGEIEVTSWGANILGDQKYYPVNEYVAVYVDDVRFRQMESDGKVNVKAGKYVRIEVPSRQAGAVVLPVDKNTGEVLLVTQFRHPQRRYLTEVPRGFGMLGIDRTAYETAKRELKEETGAVLVVNDRGTEEIYRLRSLYTDTGKLEESPEYFLVFVDKMHQQTELNRSEPTMEDPIWVNLSKFYEALYTDEEVTVEEGKDFEFCLIPENREKLNAQTKLNEGKLSIEDTFTVIVGALAKPILEKRFPKLFK